MPRFWDALLRAVFVVLLCQGLEGLKMAFEPVVVVILGVGVFGMRLFPKDRAWVAIVAGLAIWGLRNPVFAVYFALGVLGVWRLWSVKGWFWVWLVAHGLVVPKFCFWAFYHYPWMHGWYDSFGLSLLFLGAVLWKVEEARGRIGPPRLESLAFFLFPTQPLNTINFGPVEYLQAAEASKGETLRAGALCVAKSGGLLLAASLGQNWYFASLPVDSTESLSWTSLWGVTFFNYVTTVLWLSGTSDFVIAMARAGGIRLDFNYRYALLAWNPVELWRRWAIYNRKLLLKLVYFPLGGNRTNQYRNVMATFLASAWVLHSGWFGSRYWEIGLEGWRDYSVYFIVQGLAVCACLGWWRIIEKDTRSDRELRFSWGRILATMATQAFSAWVHVLILGQVSLTWEERWRWMLRAIGV